MLLVVAVTVLRALVAVATLLWWWQVQRSECLRLVLPWLLQAPPGEGPAPVTHRGIG